MRFIQIIDNHLRPNDLVYNVLTKKTGKVHSVPDGPIIILSDYESVSLASEYRYMLRKRRLSMLFLWLKECLSRFNNSSIKFFLTNPCKHHRFHV